MKQHATDFREAGRNTKPDDAFVSITSHHDTTHTTEGRKPLHYFFQQETAHTRMGQTIPGVWHGKHRGVQEQGQRRWVSMGFLQRVSRAYRHTPGSHTRSLFAFCMVGGLEAQAAAAELLMEQSWFHARNEKNV